MKRGAEIREFDLKHFILYQPEYKALLVKLKKKKFHHNGVVK